MVPLYAVSSLVGLYEAHGSPEWLSILLESIREVKQTNKQT